MDTSGCTDWTKIRRSGYKPGPNEPIELQYTASRGFNDRKKTSKRSGKVNKSGSKKKSGVKTNKNDTSSTRNTDSDISPINQT